MRLIDALDLFKVSLTNVTILGTEDYCFLLLLLPYLILGSDSNRLTRRVVLITSTTARTMLD